MVEKINKAVAGSHKGKQENLGAVNGESKGGNRKGSGSSLTWAV